VIAITVDKELRQARSSISLAVSVLLFIKLLEACRKRIIFEYHIVEMKKVCKAGREFFKNLDRLSYSCILLFTEEVSE
jgi:hypothetical protein